VVAAMRPVAVGTAAIGGLLTDCVMCGIDVKTFFAFLTFFLIFQTFFLIFLKSWQSSERQVD